MKFHYKKVKTFSSESNYGLQVCLAAIVTSEATARKFHRAIALLLIRWNGMVFGPDTLFFRGQKGFTDEPSVM